MDNMIRKNVDHPSHYNQPGKNECIEEMRELFGDLAVYWFCKLSAFKYNYRSGNKEGNSAEQDIAKADWYLVYGENLIPSMTVADVGLALAPWDELLHRVQESIKANQEKNNG